MERTRAVLGKEIEKRNWKKVEALDVSTGLAEGWGIRKGMRQEMTPKSLGG